MTTKHVQKCTVHPHQHIQLTEIGRKLLIVSAGEREKRKLLPEIERWKQMVLSSNRAALCKNRS